MAAPMIRLGRQARSWAAALARCNAVLSTMPAMFVVGGFMGHLTAWCEHHNIPYQGVPVGTIKKHATGKGNAGKDEMITSVRERGHTPVDDNEADALALLHWAIETQEV